MVLPFVLSLLCAEIAGTIRCAAKVPQDRLDDALAGMAVAVGVDSLCHFGVGGFAVQQLIRLSQNGLLLHADELRRARGDGLGPLGLAAHDKHRLAER